MTGASGAWEATVRFSARAPRLAGWVERALRPEAAREVPRAHATVRRRGGTVDLHLAARDAGALRAALNTYLGWIALSVATADVARRDGNAPAGTAAGEAVMLRAP